MATDRNKIIENYSLEELRCSFPDQSELWTAKHKILKKNFTLKRIKYRNTPIEPIRDTSLPVGYEEWCYQNVQRETNILKRLICEMAPKCHKMIKTSNNIYVVYDQFPQLILSDYLVKHPLSRPQKLILMLAIAKGLAYLHAKGIVLLNLAPSNIYLKDKNGVFFGDWALARTVEAQEKLECSFIADSYEGLAKEIVEEGKYSYWSDIYNLGNVFQKILRSGLLEQPSQINKKLEQIISKMISQRAEERPMLEEIMRVLQSAEAEDAPQKPQKVESPKNQQKSIISMKSVNDFRIKHTASTPADLEDSNSFNPFQSRSKIQLLQAPKTSHELESPSPDFTKSIKSVKSINITNKTGQMLSVSTKYIESKKSSFETLSSNSVSYGAKKKKEEQKHENIDAAKVLSKKRNLVLFLIDLSEFVFKMEVCPQLSYMLLKYSLLTLSSALEEWQRQQNMHSKEKEQVEAILINERLKITSNLTLLKEYLISIQTDPQTKKQIQTDNQINNTFLKQKIIEFGKDMVVVCQQSLSNKSSQIQLVECLFKTYMILKRIQEGTYEKFWDKIYNSEYACLQNQKYLKEERSLGHRYLKSRIADILRGK